MDKLKGIEALRALEPLWKNRDLAISDAVPSDGCLLCVPGQV
jgi:hypothetical protein